MQYQLSITSRDQRNEPIRTRVTRVTGVKRGKSVLALLLGMIGRNEAPQHTCLHLIEVF